MCHKKPGPRCSAHSLKALYDAKDARQELELRADATADDRERAEARYNDALEAWQRTPSGISDLRDRGEEALADQYQAERDAALAALRAGEGGDAPDGDLSPEQKAFFAESRAVDETSKLITVFHGSSKEFNEFDPSMLGRGNDSWGNGFYFTDQEGIALGYAHDSGSPEANVKDFYLNLKNPIYMDGVEESGMGGYRFDRDTATRILMHHPSIFMQPNEEDESGEMNPLGDYVPEFWDKDEHTHAEMEAMVRKVGREYFSDAGWVEMETTFGREHGAAFLQAVRAETGHDGVIVDFGTDDEGKSNGKHYVAWFSDQMKSPSNREPV